ncbi:MAG: SDR family oxidoreductase [Nitrospirota bacterium]|nr:MAG: SDR family oxidoreductase [Nitrospirota bacterium]
MDKLRRLEGKIAIVTGSSSGIGKAVAIRFAEEGATVIIAARRVSLSSQVAGMINERGGKALSIPTDIRNEGQVEHLISQTAEQCGGVDILVNNAGIFGGGPVADTSTAQFDDVLNTNIRGTFFCCRAGFRHMKAKGGGTIINMSSVAGTDAWAGTGTYSASKFAVMALTKALGDEGRSCGIKVCAICPGAVADDLVDFPTEVITQSGKISPFDVAETAIYLATLGPNTIVRQVIVDRLGADWS